MVTQIVDEVRSFILETILIGSPDWHLEANDSFLEKGILDSTGVLELVSYIESHYGIRCLDNEITPENLDSLNAVAAFVNRKLNEQIDSVASA
jgi:acyl carrier protein